MLSQPASFASPLCFPSSVSLSLVCLTYLLPLRLLSSRHSRLGLCNEALSGFRLDRGGCRPQLLYLEGWQHALSAISCQISMGRTSQRKKGGLKKIMKIINHSSAPAVAAIFRYSRVQSFCFQKPEKIGCAAVFKAVDVSLRKEHVTRHLCLRTQSSQGTRRSVRVLTETCIKYLDFCSPDQLTSDAA